MLWALLASCSSPQLPSIPRAGESSGHSQCWWSARTQERREECSRAPVRATGVQFPVSGKSCVSQPPTRREMDSVTAHEMFCHLASTFPQADEKKHKSLRRVVFPTPDMFWLLTESKRSLWSRCEIQLLFPRLSSLGKQNKHSCSCRNQPSCPAALCACSSSPGMRVPPSPCPKFFRTC